MQNVTQIYTIGIYLICENKKTDGGWRTFSQQFPRVAKNDNVYKGPNGALIHVP